MRFVIILCFFLLAHPEVTEAAFCEEENLVIDSQFSWDFENGFLSDFPLPTHRMGQLYPTKSVLHLGNNGTPELWGSFEFPRKPNEVGLAYNLYRLQIQIGGDNEADRQLIDQDYTGNCSGAGASLWPGERLELRPIRVEPHFDGSPRGLEIVHLRFWGK